MNKAHLFPFRLLENWKKGMKKSKMRRKDKGVRGLVIKKTNEKIETLRLQMYRKYEDNPDDPDVLRISQLIDKLLNELHAKQKKEDL